MKHTLTLIAILLMSCEQPITHKITFQSYCDNCTIYYLKDGYTLHSEYLKGSRSYEFINEGTGLFDIKVSNSIGGSTSIIYLDGNRVRYRTEDDKDYVLSYEIKMGRGGRVDH